MLFNGQFECKGIIKHLFENKIVKLVRLFWPGKEKGHLLNIAWHAYTTDHTACFWNQNGCPDTVIAQSKVSDVLPFFSGKSP